MGIRVNTVAAGLTDTDITADVKSNEQMLGMIIAQTPMGRLGDPTDIANAVILLAADRAGRITGQHAFEGVTMEEHMSWDGISLSLSTQRSKSTHRHKSSGMNLQRPALLHGSRLERSWPFPGCSDHTFELRFAKRSHAV